MINAEAMAAREAPRYGLLIRVGTATPFRVSSVIGYLETTSDDTLDPSQIYKGVGILTGLPAMRQLLGGVAERIEFRFAVTRVTTGWVDDPDSDINGAPVNVGVVFFSKTWQMVRWLSGAPPVAWVWSGSADVAAWNYDAGKETISLSCGSEFTDRGRAGMNFWTQASHTLRHAADNFCKLVVGYTIARVLKWPG